MRASSVSRAVRSIGRGGRHRVVRRSRSSAGTDGEREPTRSTAVTGVLEGRIAAEARPRTDDPGDRLDQHKPYGAIRNPSETEHDATGTPLRTAGGLRTASPVVVAAGSTRRRRVASSNGYDGPRRSLREPQAAPSRTRRSDPATGHGTGRPVSSGEFRGRRGDGRRRSRTVRRSPVTVRARWSVAPPPDPCGPSSADPARR
jgi:hypothetical protein